MASCHTHATLCHTSHRIHRIHGSFWQRIFSHRFHRCSQIFLLCQKLLWVLWLLWEDSLVGSPNLCVSVQSVGEYLAPETSVSIRAICGRLFSARNFCGKIVWLLRGYGILPYPPNPLSVGIFVGGNVRFV